MTADIPVVGDDLWRASGDTQDAPSGHANSTAPVLILPRIENLASAGGHLSLLALEIDQFALIEHLHGPEAAEVIARHLGTSVEATLRGGDRCLRSGRGQFVVLVPEGPDAAERFARAAAAGFRRTSWSPLGDVTVSAAAAQRYPGESVGSWWTRVESALAQAKAGGGGYVVVDQRRSASDPTAAPGLRLQWQARFECGEPTIDRQHRELFERSEEILESSRHGSARIVRELERLIAEIVEHFRDEERILELRAYPGLVAHRRSHANLAAKSLRLQAAAATGSASREELTRFLLGEVVADHMLTEDRRFAELFAGVHAR
ncbi:MAG TPA: hemerythrin domain-containing protein [Steroidobacteraceae bacterium]|nr:hemerythrin domain-containing protein [Steroidobacteraceae bacterium]